MSEEIAGRERQVNLENTMKVAYLDYSMSVILGRALPDVRDGLKPVHRRILHAMNELNVSYNRPYMKSARIVGDVIGKYHPHGDSAVYDATVRMTQDFNMRYPLINGQGNFGSIDGDPPAAMRYTEIRLHRITASMLDDIDKDTVDFGENYDGSLKEPKLLPAKVPALLVNGSSGIAVGMATNIPPHNISEIINALVYLIDEGANANSEGLLEIVTGPDFPTGGQILGKKGIREAYMTGRGSIQIQSKTHIEGIGSGREAIIIDELPYTVNKAMLIEKIALLVREKKIFGISDIRDESDREGMRVVIELKRNEIPETILANLMKQTRMLNSFGVIMLAVVENQPRVLNLHEILQHFLNHRVEIVTRRTRFELNKAKERAHILTGLKIALDHIDSVITLIRRSKNSTVAKEELCSQYELSDRQAQSILDMRLQRLTALEREKLEEELKQLLEKIEEHTLILKERKRVYKIIRNELLSLKADFGDERKSEIVDSELEIDMDDLVPVENMAITLSREGYIKRCGLDTYQNQNRGGRGKIAMSTNEADDIDQIIVASSHDTVLMFSDFGKVYWKKVYTLPLGSRTAKGRSMVNLLPLEKNETIVSVLPIASFEEDISLLMLTKKGIIKKTKIKEYSKPRKSGLKAILIDDDDHLISVKLCGKDDQIFIATLNGLATKFPSAQVRNIGRSTRGMTGIRLKDFNEKKDRAVSLEILSQDPEIFSLSSILTVSTRGYGKKTKIADYRLGSRANKGVLNMRINEKIGQVMASIKVREEDDVLMITQKGRVIRMNVGQISSMGRVTQGVRLIYLHDDEQLVSISKFVEPPV